MYQFTKTGSYISFFDINGNLIRRMHEKSNAVTWSFNNETIDSIYIVDFTIDGIPYNNIKLSKIEIDGTVYTSGTGFIDALAELFPSSGGGGSSVTIGGTYDTNADAVTALGTGKLYKSSSLINGSPIILITI